MSDPLPVTIVLVTSSSIHFDTSHIVKRRHLLLTCHELFSTFMITEVLQDPSMSSKLADTKATGEVRVLDDFYQMLQNDPSRAFYG